MFLKTTSGRVGGAAAWRHRPVLAPAARLLRWTRAMRCGIGCRPGLRILAYHGVCADEVASEPWVPSHFVTRSRFAEQMRILSELGRFVPLRDAVDRLASGAPFCEPSFSITFDDGHECTMRHGAETMRDLGIPATFFVSTGPVSERWWFVSDRLRVLGCLPEPLRSRMPPQLRDLASSPQHAKRHAHDEVRAMVDAFWPGVVDALDPRVGETLRPMTWDQVASLERAGHEVGAHTRSHTILARETGRRREEEISGSIRDIRARLGSCVGFAYPNGCPGDFDDGDIAVLGRAGVQYAVTTNPGRCTAPANLYRLPRTVIGLGHPADVFTIEMTGLLDRRRRRQQVADGARPVIMPA